MKHYIEEIETEVPVIIKLISYKVIPPWKGHAITCPSSDDYYGQVELEYELQIGEITIAECQLSDNTREDIEDQIIEFMEY